MPILETISITGSILGGASRLFGGRNKADREDERRRAAAAADIARTLSYFAGLPSRTSLFSSFLQGDSIPTDTASTTPDSGIGGGGFPPFILFDGATRTGLPKTFLPGFGPDQDGLGLPRVNVGLTGSILKGILKRLPKLKLPRRVPRQRRETEVERAARQARERAAKRPPRRGRIDLPKGPLADPPSQLPQVPPEIAPEVTEPGQLPNVRTTPDLLPTPRPITQVPAPRPSPGLSGAQLAGLGLLGAVAGAAVSPLLLGAPGAAAAAGLALAPGGSPALSPSIPPLTPGPVTGPLGRIDVLQFPKQQPKTQTKRRRCEKTRRKNRKTCWTGLYREFPTTTKFEKWYARDCKSGEFLEKTERK